MPYAAAAGEARPDAAPRLGPYETAYPVQRGYEGPSPVVPGGDGRPGGEGARALAGAAVVAHPPRTLTEDRC